IFTFFGRPHRIPRSRAHSTKERLRKNLIELEKFKEGKEFVYFTAIDSDDMFHKDAVQEIQCCDYKDNGALYYPNTYVLDLRTQKMIDYYTKLKFCLPFYTLLFRGETFFDHEKHFEVIKNLENHLLVTRAFDAFRLKNGMCMMTIHGYNASSRWGTVEKKRKVNGEEKLKVLKDFGLNNLKKNVDKQ
ncbi:unnamed protein product, partial [marine sediment metagenome]